LFFQQETHNQIKNKLKIQWDQLIYTMRMEKVMT
jgi:hypothetical protein